MSNILPGKKKKLLKRQYILRLTSLLLLALTGASLVGSVLAVPIYITSGKELSDISARKNSEEVDRKGYAESLKAVRSINSLLDSISKMDESNAGSSLDELGNIQKQFRGGVSIRSINYKKGNKKDDTIRISGIAKDRSVLSSFAGALKKSEIFKKVNLPLASLADSEETPFAIVINL